MLGALLVTAAIAIPLLVRARRRRAWHNEMANVTDEVEWFARTLIPQLQGTGSTEQAAGGWSVAESRVVAAEDHLTALEARAPSDESSGRARRLRDAVRTAREDVARVMVGQPAADLQTIALRLEDALRALRGPASP